LVSLKVPGVLILDPEKVGEVAVKVAQKIAPIRKKMKSLPELDEIKELAKKCRNCNMCQRSCPQDLKIPVAIKAAAEGNLVPLAELTKNASVADVAKKHAQSNLKSIVSYSKSARKTCLRKRIIVVQAEVLSKT
jgi:CO dehydrogenase/acetyl-CoA synthase alpha subunit